MAAVGIDLGTTHTVVACSIDGEVHVLADDEGSRLLPSVVNFHPSGDVLVGQEAKNRRLVDPTNTIASIKRLIGRPWDSEELRVARARFGFELREGSGREALVVTRGESYTLPEVSAFVLRRARQIAEAALGETVDQAVLTVPAHFNELQRAATKVAGRIAGLEVLRIVNEPTAAALACGFGVDKAARVAIYDFGGGTFDCSILDLTGSLFEVLATSGDTFLGGDDIDTAIAEAMCTAFVARHRHDPRVDPQAFERLRAAAEELKRLLSTNYHAEVDVSEITHGEQRALGFHFGMRLGDLEAIASPFIERTLKVTQDALSIANLPHTSLDHIILVGGSTRMPLVARRVASFFETSVLNQIDPDEIVAIGAAIQAAALVDTSRSRSIPAAPVPGVIGAPQPLDDDSRESTLASAAPQSQRSGPPKGRRATLPIPGAAPKTLFPPVAVPPPADLLPPSAAPATLNHPEMHPGEERSFVTASRGAALGDLPLARPEVKPLAPRHTIPAGAAPPSPESPKLPGPARRPQPVTVPTMARVKGPMRPESTTPAKPLLGRERTLPQEDGPTQIRPPTASPPPLPQRSAPPPKPSPARASSIPKAPVQPLDTEDISMIAPSHRGPDDEDPTRAGSTGAPPSHALWARAGDIGPLATDDISIIAPAGVHPGTPRALMDLPGRVPVPPSSAPSDVSNTLPSPQQAARGAPAVPVARPSKPPAPRTQAPPPLPARAPPPAATPLPFGPLFEADTGEMSIPSVPSIPMEPPAPPPPRAPTRLPPQEPRFAPPPQPQVESRGSFASRIGLEGPPPAGVAREHPPEYEEDALPPPRPRTKAPVLVDVTPSTLIVETVGGYCDTVIARNATIPCEHTRVFATGRDLQVTVHVRVAQGESPKFDENQYLGEVEVTHLRPAPRGEVLVSVTFELDANGSLIVRATDASTGIKAEAAMKLITLTHSDKEIEEMMERSLSLSVKARSS